MRYEDFGFFLRPRAYYDFAYSGSNAHDSPLTNNNGPVYGGPLGDNDEFADETQDRHRDTIEILDAFAYGEVDLAGHSLSLRAGRQVVSWGESLFLPGGISSAQSPVDATATNAPGVELKDIFLPVGQVYSQVGVFANLTLSGFYQWEWDKTRLDESGAYFSTSDFLDDAGERILVPVPAAGGVMTVERSGDQDPRDSGQWGVALHYLVEGLNDTEFGLYYVNYHEKGPQVIGEMGAAGPLYHLEYAEDVKLVGGSFSTLVGETNVSGEVSYRFDVPVSVVDPTQLLHFGYRDADVLQAQLSMIQIISGTPLWDRAVLMAEAGCNRVYGVGGGALTADRFAWGYAAKITFDYLNVLSGLDLAIPITLKDNPNGVSPVAGTFAEKQDSVAVALDFTYLGVYKVGIGYTEFLNGADKNPKADRDYLSVNFKYTF